MSLPHLFCIPEVEPIFGPQEEKISSGVYGTIYKTRDNYALKKFKNRDKDLEESSFLNELLILKRLSHPNIISPCAAKLKSPTIIVLPLMDGNLRDLLYGLTSNLTSRKWVFYQIFSALSYLATNRVKHLDIKPENILWEKPKEKPTIKLADFGISEINHIRQESDIQSLYWRAPEIIIGDNRRYDWTIDCWSVGVILFEAITGRIGPLAGDNETDQIRKIIKLIGLPPARERKKYKLPGWVSDNSDSYQEGNLAESVKTEENEFCLLKSLLTWPKQRVLAKDALTFDYFKGHEPVEELSAVVDCCYRLNPRIEVACYQILTGWLVEVADEYELSYQTLFGAYNLLNRYLTSHQLERKIFQKVAVACLFLNSQIYDLYFVTLADLSYITDRAYSSEEINQMATEILTETHCDILRDNLGLELISLGEEYDLSLTDLGLSKEVKTNIKFEHYRQLQPAHWGVLLNISLPYVRQYNSKELAKLSLQIWQTLNSPEKSDDSDISVKIVIKDLEDLISQIFKKKD